MKSEQWMALFLTIFTILRIIKFVPTMPAPLYFAIWGICAFYIIIRGYYRFNYLFLLFVICCFLSIIGNVIPSKYNVGLRFTGFLLIVSCVGPLIESDWLYELRRNCFNYVSIVLLLVTIISFLIYCIYPSSMLTERGHLYGGITLHSMQLGPIAGLCTIYSTYKYLTITQKSYNKGRIGYIIAIIISLFSCVLAGSRSALLATVISGIICIYLFYRENTTKFLKIVSILLLIILITSPIWWNYTEAIQTKMEISEDHGGFLTSRSSSWEARIHEFLDNPLIGCGFATVVGKFSERGAEGQVEPGNGWLFILSSTGIMTFIIFIGNYIYDIFKLYFLKTKESILLICQLIFIGCHINAEGYTLSSGIFLFYYLWLLLGYTYSYLNQQINKL